MDNDRPEPPDPGTSRPAVTDAVDPEQVARFLADNPDWIARSDLYHVLEPPRRVHGERLADHMAAMVDAARRRAEDMSSRADQVLQAGRAARSIAERVQEAVLALIRTPDPADALPFLLPELLGLDAAGLCMEADGAGRDAAGCAARPLPPGTVERLLGNRDVRLRDAPADAVLLHGEAAPLARHDALLRVAIAGSPPALLALARRDGAVLDDGQPAGAGGEAMLAFLGRAVGARLEAWLALRPGPRPVVLPAKRRDP
jgi:uncharacterized protein YigA (DUF484 family)